MYAFRLRAAAVALVAGVGLAGCTTPYGYNGVSVGVGNGGYYDPYYGDYGYGGGYPAYGAGYGYGGGYPGYGYGGGYPGYGYGYAPYFGWYDNFYYPGSGYYVYDRYRRPHRWTDKQRRHWEACREHAMNNKDLRRQLEAKPQNWDGFEAGPTAVTQPVRTRDGQRVRVERARPVGAERTNRADRIERANRADGVEQVNQLQRAERSSARTEAREQRQAARAERVEQANQVQRVEPVNQAQRAERITARTEAREQRQAARAERQSEARSARQSRSESRERGTTQDD